MHRQFQAVCMTRGALIGTGPAQRQWGRWEHSHPTCSIKTMPWLELLCTSTVWQGPRATLLCTHSLAKAGETAQQQDTEARRPAQFTRRCALWSEFESGFPKAGIIPLPKPAKNMAETNLFFFLPWLKLNTHLQAKSQLEGSKLY